MKKIILLIIIIINNYWGFGQQNLIPNPGFEIGNQIMPYNQIFTFAAANSNINSNQVPLWRRGCTGTNLIGGSPDLFETGYTYYANGSPNPVYNHGIPVNKWALNIPINPASPSGSKRYVGFSKNESILSETSGFLTMGLYNLNFYHTFSDVNLFVGTGIIEAVLRSSSNPCANGLVVFTSNISPIGSWVHASGNFSISQNQSMIYDRIEYRIKSTSNGAVFVDDFSLTKIDLNPLIIGMKEFCEKDEMTFNGSITNGTNSISHLWEVQECTINGVLIGSTLYSNWFSGNPTTFTIPNSLNLPCNKYYRIKLAPSNNVSGEWYEKTIIIKINCSQINVDLESIYYNCNNNPLELCGPTPPQGITYNYSWGIPSSGLSLGIEQCLTITHPGNYSLIVSDPFGCSSVTHNFTVTNQLPTLELGHDIVICKGENQNIPSINISNQGFDNGNFTITWYRNGNIIQNGGTVLQMTPVSGTISVVVSSPGCNSQTDQINIIVKRCCPELVNIGIMLCKGEEPVFHVLNQGFDNYNTTITWLLDGQVIQNGGEVLEIPVYGNGKLTVTINKPGCPEISDTILISCNNDGKQTACFKFKNVVSQKSLPSYYGPMTINEFCLPNKVFIDGSCSQNESGYYLRISEFNLNTWTAVQDLYSNWVSASGTAPASINLNDLVGINFVPGKIYLVSIATGPVWTSAPPQFFRVLNCVKSDTEIIDFKENYNVAIYPNPTNGNVNFIFDKNETGKVEIYSLEGKQVHSENFKENKELSANLGNFQAGIYIARITIGEETITKKIIKE